MPDQEPEETVEEQIGTETADAFEITTEGASVTGKRLYADGGDGQEKEVNILSQHAGASSDAPAESGIPSAMAQSGSQRNAVADREDTPMPDRVQPTRQDLTP